MKVDLASSIATRPSWGTRLAGIEGLRALAAGTILIAHGWQYMSPDGAAPGRGEPIGTLFENLALGVTLFFTLSGFLLYRPFVAGVLRGRALPSIGAYARNRALRILPAYWLILVATGLLMGAVGVREGPDELALGRLDEPLVLLQNALLLQNVRPGSLGTGIGPAWSLAVEAVFYVVLPLLGLLAAALAGSAASRRRRLVAALAPALLLLVVGASGKWAAAELVPGGSGYSGDWHSVVERSFWTHADLFAFGMVVAILRVEAEDRRLRLPGWWPVAATIAACALGLACAATFDGDQLSGVPQDTVFAAVCALLLALVVLPPWSSRLSAGLEARPLVALGAASYSVFLWHEPLAHWLREQGLTVGGWTGLALNLVLLAAVTGVLATLTYRLVEAPAMRRKLPTRRGEETAMPGYQAQAVP